MIEFCSLIAQTKKRKKYKTQKTKDDKQAW